MRQSPDIYQAAVEELPRRCAHCQGHGQVLSTTLGKRKGKGRDMKRKDVEAEGVTAERNGRPHILDSDSMDSGSCWNDASR